MDPIDQYQNGRRLEVALGIAKTEFPDFQKLNVLTVCGGYGLEGTVFLDHGFGSVTASDILPDSLEPVRARDPRIQTKPLNAEQLDVPDNSYDIAFVQDGLHHLPRPALGLTEMLRVAKKGVIVMEPYLGLVTTYFGYEYEHQEYGNPKSGILNYIFRWNKNLIEQVVKSYLLHTPVKIKFIRMWHHNIIPQKVIAKIPFIKNNPVFWTKMLYKFLDTFFAPLGNNMIAIISYDKK